MPANPTQPEPTPVPLTNSPDSLGEGETSEQDQFDPVIDTMQAVVEGIVAGRDISSYRGKIERLISNQESRAELIDNLILTHDYTRLLKFIKTRSKLEDSLLELAETENLTPHEKMVLLRYVSDEAKFLGNKVKAGSSSVKDILGLLNRVDFHVQVSQKELEKRLSTTSPQGREIVRRTAYRLLKLSGSAQRNSVPDE